MKSDIIDIEGVVHHGTDFAVLFSETGDSDDAVWLPKSQIEYDEQSVTLPEWLAREKGLI